MEISKPVERVDLLEKCQGNALFVDDLEIPGLLHAVTLRSRIPRGRIKRIKAPEIPENYWIVDYRDVPGKNSVKMLSEDMPFFAEDKVNYIGEPILLVVGEDKEKAKRILKDIYVEYEEIEPVFTIEDALNGNAPPIYGDNNRFVEYEFSRGDVDDAFRKAYRIVEGEYRTGLQEHIYLEPQGMIGIYSDGKVKVIGSMQCPYYVKNALVHGLGWPEDRIQVVQATTGGGFGGKEDFPSLIAGHVAFASIKTGRPVKLILERNEDILSTTKRHPSIVRHRTALDRDGNILGMDVEVILDAGAYITLSPVVLQRAIFAGTGVYKTPNLHVRGIAVATNHVPSGAFRGFGSPQAFFGVELHGTNLSEEMGISPLEYKKSMSVRRGDLTPTSGRFRSDVKIDEIMNRLDKLSGFTEKYQKYRDEKWKGIGVSLFFHGCGFTGDGEVRLDSRVKLAKREDGKVEILVSTVEMGQGAQTALRKIVSHALNIPIEQVIYRNPDTDRVPDSGPTVASRTVMIVGGLLQRACEKLKDHMGEMEYVVEERFRMPEYVRWDQKKLHGDSYPEYSWGGVVVEVEVDPVTFEVKTSGMWGVYDVGIPIDERIIMGQLEGGMVQALGWAYLEKMGLKKGFLIPGTITDYTIPTAKDVPEIVVELVRSPYEYGPFGAKCAGELPFVGVAPAFASAVQQATGIRIDKIPITPEYLLEKMNGD